MTWCCGLDEPRAAAPASQRSPSPSPEIGARSRFDARYATGAAPVGCSLSRAISGAFCHRRGPRWTGTGPCTAPLLSVDRRRRRAFPRARSSSLTGKETCVCCREHGQEGAAAGRLFALRKLLHVWADRCGIHERPTKSATGARDCHDPAVLGAGNQADASPVSEYSPVPIATSLESSYHSRFPSSASSRGTPRPAPRPSVPGILGPMDND